MVVRTLIAALIACAALGMKPVRAQDWPTKPIRIVTGFAAGGIGDLGARLLAEHITRTTGQQAVVENRTGAAGTLGMDVVAKAPPDGHTLAMISVNHAVNVPLYTTPFDTLKDLTALTVVYSVPLLLVAVIKALLPFQALRRRPVRNGTSQGSLSGRPPTSRSSFACASSSDM